MRYITILFLAGVLVACQTSSEARRHYDRQENFYGMDFTKYTSEDFLITPKSYDGEYQSIGVLRVEIWPEMNRSAEEITGDRVTDFSDWHSKPIKTKTVVDSLYQKAKRMGADAIIDFRTQRLSQSIDDGTRVGVEARGFAIDRK